MAKHFVLEDEEDAFRVGNAMKQSQEEAALDGMYVVRTKRDQELRLLVRGQRLRCYP